MRSEDVEKVIGRVPAWERMAKDSDGDGVPNLLDCRPNDPKRQGIIHDIANVAKKKLGEVRERRDRDREVKRQADEAYQTAKGEEAIRVAKARARIEADRKIKYHKEGGFVGQLSRGAGARPRPAARSVRVKAAGKKSKKKKKARVVYRTVPAKKESSEVDIWGKSRI